MSDIRMLEISMMGKDGGEFIASPSRRIPTQTPSVLEQVCDIFSGDLYLKKYRSWNPDTYYQYNMAKARGQ